MELLPNSPERAAKSDRLFNGIWLRWEVLSQSERVCAACIALIPLWWLWGWSYLLALLGFSLLAYEYRSQGKIDLKPPHPIVLFLFAYGAYGLIIKLFYGSIYPSEALSANDFIGAFNSIFGPGITIWYIQSKGIRVRPQVVAWAFSFVITLMFIYWVFIYFGLRESSYNPPRSLFAILTRKSATYVIGQGNSNYLLAYRAEDSSIPGFARYSFFFPGPESAALVECFVSLLALDIKNRLWSYLLLGSSLFLLLLSGTRSAWLALAFVMVVRWLLTAGKKFGVASICALIGFVSFVTLCLPPVTNFVLNISNNTAKATGEMRGDSTEVRGEIYRQTIERLKDSSDFVFLFGHVVPGETVLPGYAPAMVGTHSFYLGSLLYQRGLIGATLFAAFWISLIGWLYQTRTGRPLSCLLIFMVFTFTFSVMVMEPSVIQLILVTVVTRQPSVKHLKRVGYA